jgi:sugar phosphate isomerase/epimerase
MSNPVLGLQLYTLREPMAKDFVGVLGKVGEMGYEAVEFAGTGGLTGTELRKVLDDLGLRVAGMHQPINVLEDDLPSAVTMAQELGTTNLVCPFLPEDRRGDAEAWAATGGVLDGIGAKCRTEGLQLSYHNHSFEFVKFGGRYGLDILFENCSPANVLSELDTYWVRHGGEDPVEYIQKYSGRISILHVKDMDESGPEPTFTEIGRGVLDWSAIHQAAVPAGVEWYCVEQDRCAGDPMDSARASAEFMRSLLG